MKWPINAGNPMQALCVVSLFSPPTFRSRSLLSVIRTPHCPRQRAHHCVLLLASISALGTAPPHSIRTTLAPDVGRGGQEIRHTSRNLCQSAMHVSVGSRSAQERNRCCHGQQQLTAVVATWALQREDRGAGLNIPARSAYRAFLRRLSVSSDETYTRHMSFHCLLRSQQRVSRRVC